MRGSRTMSKRQSRPPPGPQETQEQLPRSQNTHRGEVYRCSPRPALSRFKDPPHGRLQYSHKDPPGRGPLHHPTIGVEENGNVDRIGVTIDRGRASRVGRQIIHRVSRVTRRCSPFLHGHSMGVSQTSLHLLRFLKERGAKIALASIWQDRHDELALAFGPGRDLTSHQHGRSARDTAGDAFLSMQPAGIF